jgi:hypothetical protein
MAWTELIVEIVDGKPDIWHAKVKGERRGSLLVLFAKRYRRVVDPVDTPDLHGTLQPGHSCQSKVIKEFRACRSVEFLGLPDDKILACRLNYLFGH